MIFLFFSHTKGGELRVSLSLCDWGACLFLQQVPREFNGFSPYAKWPLFRHTHVDALIQNNTVLTLIRLKPRHLSEMDIDGLTLSERPDCCISRTTTAGLSVSHTWGSLRTGRTGRGHRHRADGRRGAAKPCTCTDHLEQLRCNVVQICVWVLFHV